MRNLKSMPEISVVVPVYQVEKYLARCIESILAQTYTDFEVILVDDGSFDNSGDICEKYAISDSRIRVIHKKNGGLSSARNAGLDVAVGEYVTFIDSDDVIHPQYLEVLYRECEKNAADISIGRLARFQKNEEIKAFKSITGIRGALYDSTYTLNCFFDKEKTVSNYVSACCKLFKRNLFQNIRFPEGRLFEDEFTTYRLYYAANAVVDLDEVLYYYFINDAGITQNLSLQKRFDEYDAQWERLEFFREQNLTELYEKALLEFLRSAQWDIIACNQGREQVKESNKIHFIGQYRLALSEAKKMNLVNFMKNYDYYVIAYPGRIYFYRVLRKLKLLLNI